MEYALLGDARVEILDKELRPIGLINIPLQEKYRIGLTDSDILFIGKATLNVPFSEIERIANAEEINKKGLLVEIKTGIYVIINNMWEYQLNTLKHYVNPLILT